MDDMIMMTSVTKIAVVELSFVSPATEVFALKAF